MLVGTTVEVGVGLGCLEGIVGVVVGWEREGLVGASVEIGVGLGCLEGAMGVEVGGKLERLVAIVVVGRRDLVTIAVIIIIVVAAIIVVVVPVGVPVVVPELGEFLVGGMGHEVGSSIFVEYCHGCRRVVRSFGSVEGGPSVVSRTWIC